MLDENFQRNASRFAKLLEYENPSSFFVFDFVVLIFFALMNTLVIHEGKNKVAPNEKRKKNTWVFVFQEYGKFWSISVEHFVKHKLWNCEECSTSVVPKE